MRDCTNVSRHRHIRASAHLRNHGFTVTELVVVIVVLALFVLVLQAQGQVLSLWTVPLRCVVPAVALAGYVLLERVCQVLYVLFDDLMETDEDHQIAKFRVGHAGWQYGGKIVLLDEQEQPYSVLVSRKNRVVTLQKGDIEFLLPKAKDEVLF